MVVAPGICWSLHSPLPHSAGDTDVCDTMLGFQVSVCYLSSGPRGCRIVTLTFEHVTSPQIPNFYHTLKFGPVPVLTFQYYGEI